MSRWFPDRYLLQVPELSCQTFVVVLVVIGGVDANRVLLPRLKRMKKVC